MIGATMGILGIILTMFPAATHELEFTNLVNKRYKNYHFKEIIEKNGYKFFDYILRQGPCTTRNAIAILKHLGYPVEIHEKSYDGGSRKVFDKNKIGCYIDFMGGLDKMEIWDILDENGNKTGRTIIRGEKLEVDEYHLVVHIWIINSNGEILIQKRPEHLEFAPEYGQQREGLCSPRRR